MDALRCDLMDPHRTGVHTKAAVDAGVFLKHNLDLPLQTFRVGAPFAAQRTAFEEYDGADSRSIIHIVFLNIKDQSFSFHDISPNCPTPGLKMSQHGTADDLILYILAQLYEESTVSGNTHDQVAVLLWMLLSLDQGLVIQIVKLHLAVSKHAGCTQQGDQAFLALRSIKKACHDLEVMYHTDVHIIIGHLGYRLDNSGRALEVSALAWLIPSDRGSHAWRPFADAPVIWPNGYYWKWTEYHGSG